MLNLSSFTSNLNDHGERLWPGANGRDRSGADAEHGPISVWNFASAIGDAKLRLGWLEYGFRQVS